jgi:hypothetical protein
VISCGANVPLLIKKSFGPIMEDVDHKVRSLTLYLIVVARVFAYFMEKKVQMTDEAIFHDTQKL